MGIRIIGAVSAIVISVAVSAPAFAQAGSASAFLRPIYDGMRDGENAAPEPQRIYSAGLLSLMRSAARQAGTPDDEIGPFDFSPLCDCQDAIAGYTLNVLEQGASKARVRVNIDTGDDQGRHSVTLNLIRQAGGWRIDEITSTPSFASYRALLRNGWPRGNDDTDGDTGRVAGARIGQRDAYGRVIGVPFRDGAVARNILRNGPGAGYWPRRMVLLPADQVEADYDDSVVLVPAE